MGVEAAVLGQLLAPCVAGVAEKGARGVASSHRRRRRHEIRGGGALYAAEAHAAARTAAARHVRRARVVGTS